MRFLFIGFPTTVFPEIVDVAKELKKRGHKIVHWVRASGFAPDLPEEIKSLVEFRWNYEWSDEKNPWVINNMEKIPPLDAEDLSYFAPYESTILYQLNRIYPNHKVPELYRNYYEYLRCWKGLFLNLKPDIVVFRTIPHEPTNTIIFHLAKKMGIKILIFNQLWVSDRILPMSDFEQGTADLRQYKESINWNVNLDELSPDLLDYYQSQTSKTKDNTPVYMPNIMSSYTISGRTLSRIRSLFRKDLHRGFWYRLTSSFRLFFFWLGSRLSRELPSLYKKLSSEPDMTKPFVYFPLHFQPELSTNPVGGIFRDQLMALELLAASLPVGWEIYVKEHPTQWKVGSSRHNSYRPKNYYHSITKFSSVKLVPIETDSFELISKSRSVSVISGTAGWEALLRGKPVMIFGYPWYQDAPGVYQVEDLSSCKDAFEKIEKGERSDQKEMLQYLKRLDELSFRGCLDLEYRSDLNFFKLTKEEHANNILEAILKNI